MRHLAGIVFYRGRLTELTVKHGLGVRVSRTDDLKRIDEDFSRGRNEPAYWPYQSVRSRSTDFWQVGFEPGQVPIALKPAFYLGF